MSLGMAVEFLVNPVPERYLPLFKAAGAEVGIDYAVEPDFEEYRLLMDSGDYVFVGAESDGSPVGYVGILFCTSLFNRRIVHAIVDSFYVMPGFRRGLVAGRLIERAERFVRGRAGRMVFQCEDGNPLSKMLLRRGFRVVDCTFEKVF